ncbi:hypothetical protein Pfo_027141 [Paulownia fortunei]|nr:hypothetical protein Pfo_027141 [Paulownia fortunei]
MIKYILLSLILSVNSSPTLACFLGKFFSYNIHVVNNLPPNIGPLLVHCASKNNDLGYHTLTSNQDFHFHFCSKPLSTLFFCHLWWGKKNKAFDVYNAKWKINICKQNHQCYWAAKTDGIYFSDSYPPQKLTKGYNWE